MGKSTRWSLTGGRRLGARLYHKGVEKKWNFFHLQVEIFFLFFKPDFFENFKYTPQIRFHILMKRLLPACTTWGFVSIRRAIWRSLSFSWIFNELISALSEIVIFVNSLCSCTNVSIQCFVDIPDLNYSRCNTKHRRPCTITPFT